MSLKTATEKLAKEWKGTDELLRSEILRIAAEMHRSASEVIGLIPKPLIDAATAVFLAALPKLLLGKSVEDIVIEASSAIPELSPYVRQLLGE